MELYILDNLFRHETIVDRYESLIWTERFSEIGEFELVAPSTHANRTSLQIGKKLALNVSHRVMVVETTENTVGSDGQRILKVTGRSLESYLEDRVVVNESLPLTTTSTTTLTTTTATTTTTTTSDPTEPNWSVFEGSSPWQWRAGLAVSMSSPSEGDTSVTLTWTAWIGRENTAAASNGQYMISGLTDYELWDTGESPYAEIEIGTHTETIILTSTTQTISRTMSATEQTYGTTPGPVSNSVTVPAFIPTTTTTTTVDPDEPIWGPVEYGLDNDGDPLSWGWSAGLKVQMVPPVVDDIETTYVDVVWSAYVRRGNEQAPGSGTWEMTGLPEWYGPDVWGTFGDQESPYILLGEKTQRVNLAEDSQIITNTLNITEDNYDVSPSLSLSFLVPSLYTPEQEFLTSNSVWVISGTPMEIGYTLFNEICKSGIVNPNDLFPQISSFRSPMFPEDSIDPHSLDIRMEFEIQTLYDAIKKVCDLYDMGFRIVRNHTSSQLYFDLYMGSDRSTQQSYLNPVVFSTELDNLQNTTELTTAKGAKNVAYVFSSRGFVVVTGNGVAPDVDGFDRRVLIVKAENISDDIPASLADQYMIQQGTEALAQHRVTSAFDGEVERNSEYLYGRDYYLGDIIEFRNSDGIKSIMRVTEQIFVSDAEGDRAYPTLSMNLFITPGSWLSWDYNQVWEDFGLTDYWATL